MRVLAASIGIPICLLCLQAASANDANPASSLKPANISSQFSVSVVSDTNVDIKLAATPNAGAGAVPAQPDTSDPIGPDNILPNSSPSEKNLVDPSKTPKSDAKTADRISVVGSDAMASLIQAWVDGYAKVKPGMKVQVLTQGSAAAAAALIDGTADLAPMARAMSTDEIAKFKHRYGVLPMQVVTAYSATAIFVARSNALPSLSLKQVDSIFSSERKRGGDELSLWSQVNVGGRPVVGEIAPIIRDPESTLSGFFRQQALLQGKFTSRATVVVDNKALYATLGRMPNSIGFGEPVSAANIASEQVRELPISKDGATAFLPDDENIEHGRYPLSRALSIYVNKSIGEALKPKVFDFLKFVMGPEGRNISQAQGFKPLTENLGREQEAKFTAVDPLPE